MGPLIRTGVRGVPPEGGPKSASPKGARRKAGAPTGREPARSEQYPHPERRPEGSNRARDHRAQNEGDSAGPRQGRTHRAATGQVAAGPRPKRSPQGRCQSTRLRGPRLHGGQQAPNQVRASKTQTRTEHAKPQPEQKPAGRQPRRWPQGHERAGERGATPGGCLQGSDRMGASKARTD